MGRMSRRVALVTLGHKNDHTLSSPSEQHSICIDLVLLVSFAADLLPLGSLECATIPAIAVSQQVSVPTNHGPIQLQALDFKFGSRILEVKRRTHIAGTVEKPLTLVPSDAGWINTQWFQSARTG